MRRLAFVIMVGLVLLGPSRADAATITLTPADMIAGNVGPGNCEPGCIYTAFGLPNTGALELLYRSNVGGAEEGAATATYDTTYANSATDPQDATIAFISGIPVTCPMCFLAVKGGSQNPSYYFYDLSLWNGTDTIALRGFWPDQGAISHVSIWFDSQSTPSVPEPATLTLVGVGLAALARRRFRARRQS